MHISKIELENIKSHAGSTFEFGCGTTAITGENGAGKTTIIEAIAWALFDLLEYKKEDFIRRGTKKGVVRVTFESGLDEREYIVYRDTGTGYHVTDPRLTTRIADKKEEVFRFLWQHLGLEPGTDLRSLFRQAIGVPQGTFTAIFLEGATERKVAFDRLLKVEEYRQAAEKLRETSRYLDTQVAGIREDIARAEGELSRSENVDEEHKTYAKQTKKLAAEIETIAKDLAEKQVRVTTLDETERKLTSLQTAFDRLRSNKEKAEFVLREREQNVARSTDAAKKITAVQADHNQHIETLGRLKELERERVERDKFRTELARTEAAIVNIRADQNRLNADLKIIQNAHREIESLRPKAAVQDLHENELAVLRDRVASARATGSQITSLDEKLERMRYSFRTNQAQLKNAETKTVAAAGLTGLETRDGELLRELSTLRAGLERDEKFQSEINNGLCPILSQKCLNLKSGETLESFVSSQFSDLRSQITAFEAEQATVTANLKAAREAAQFAAALVGYRQREAELKEEGTRLNEEKAGLEKLMKGLHDSEHQLATAEAKLKSLDDPRSRIRFLEKETAKESDLRANVTNIESNLERLENDRNITVEQLESYKDLDDNWTKFTNERDATIDAHRIFLANEGESKLLGERQTQLETAQSELAAQAKKAGIAEKDLTSAGAGYDRDRHNAEKAELLSSERLHAETRATFDAAKRREEQLAAELKRFTEIRKSLADEFKEKERLDVVAEATAFIRDTLKEAAPRVARNYVYHVSLEANLMFREITGNAERTLKWVEDYSIVLEEEGHERPFQSLSGGEQMAAALSVRLALLKQLTDIRIAFFDEPTTNMDAERRENLAMQISRITHFDQLFVISHDETFDSYVDNVVSVERERND